MKRAIYLFFVLGLVNGLAAACSLNAAGFGASAEDVLARLQTSNKALPLQLASLPKFDFSALGREVCPNEPALDRSVINYTFAFGHLVRIEIRHSGAVRLLGLARRLYGPALRARRSEPEADRPVLRWDTASAYVLYRGHRRGQVWDEYLSVSGKQQQEVLQRAYRARELGGKP